LAVHRIVLDAGHGGRDAGTTATDITEKDITLDIETRLRALLLRHGFEVVTTRADDRLIALRERARMANSSSGDIFVSIHVNSLQTHVDSHGIETYYLGPTNDPSLTRLAAAENLVSGYSIADMRKLLDRVYADVRRDESHQLASSVQQQLFAGLRAVDPGLENWGVKRAPFIVLTATEMPAILAEVGCLSNQIEAQMLRNPTYRQQIAQALFNGIQAYANENAEGRKQKAEG
jgi:N-acetylmuramoyl-L-alanine amidase